MSHLRLYTLKTLNGKTELSFDLTGNIIDQNSRQTHIILNGKDFILQNREWLNTMKVFDDGKTYFLLCSKHVDLKYAKSVLIDYTIQLMDKRIANMIEFKERILAEKKIHEMPKRNFRKMIYAA